MKRSKLLLICLTAAWQTSALAWSTAFSPDPEPPGPSDIRPGSPWKEGPTAMPPWPKDADLVELHLEGPQDAFRYFIDGKNLQIGADKVVRYTVVAEGRNGARNASFEGLRCTLKGQYKVYAYGAGDRFAPLGGQEWQRIDPYEGEPYRSDLWRFHLCVPREQKPRPRKDMIRSLQGHIAPRQNTGFQAD